MRFVIGCLTVVFLTQAANSASIRVPGEQPTIQAGIDVALASDTVLVSEGTYTGEGNRDIDFLGKAIVVKSENGPAATIIDCQGSDTENHRGIIFQSGEDLSSVLDGFTIQNSYLSSGGGAIKFLNSEATVKNCVISDNTGFAGAAIHCNKWDLAPRIVNCTIVGNYAIGGEGSALWGGSPHLVRTIIANNLNRHPISGNHSIVFECCDIFGNYDGNWPQSLIDQYGINGNISVSPRFQNPSTGDYHLYSFSECAQPNSECGERIGALGVGGSPEYRTWTVSYRGYGDATTIQAGIDSAGYGDTVVVISGVYSGSGNRDLDFFGKSIVLKSESDAATTIIDCEGTVNQPHRGFIFRAGEDSLTVVEGLTIRNGTGAVDDLLQYSIGGGVYFRPSTSPIIRNCIIRDCEADAGGGMHCGMASPLIENCQFTSNESRDYGGGFDCFKSVGVRVVDCTFADNVSDAFGSGLTCREGSNIEVLNSDFANNLTHYSGALSIHAATALVQDCRFDGNLGSSLGSAIHLGLSSITTLTGCVLTKNYSEFAGGAIWGVGAKASMSHCVFVGNVAMHMSSNGGAVFLQQVDSDISNSTFLYNEVSDIGAIVESDSTTRISNCILAYNKGGKPFWFPNPGKVVVTCTNIYSNPFGNWVSNYADWLGQFGNISEDPLLCDWASGDYRIAQTSPCAPTNSVCRQLIGAGEVGCGTTSRVLRINADGTGDVPNIQAAIHAAAPGDTILLEDGVYTGFGNKDLSLYGKNIVLTSQNGPEYAIIDCQATESAPGRTFLIDHFEDSNTIIQDITMRGGYTLNGAGAFCDTMSSPKFINVVFRDNVATLHAGALAIQRASPKLLNCRFEGNRAYHGGAAVTIESRSTFDSCSFVRNATEMFGQYHGGAIMTWESPLILRNCLFDRNEGGYGGALYIWAYSNPEIIECTFFGNKAADGSAIYAEYFCTPKLVNSIFVANDDWGQWSDALQCNGIAGFEIECCNFFGNSKGDYTGCYEQWADTNGNFSSDPLFCDTANSKFSLVTGSICLPDNNSCGVQIGAFGSGCTTTDVADSEGEDIMPIEFALSQNYPNPFNPTTVIEFALPEASHVRLDVYNVLGQRVITLLDERKPTGYHIVSWDGRNSNGDPLASGLYFYRIVAEGFVSSKKMLLLK